MAREIEGHTGIAVLETEISGREIDVSARVLDFPMSEVEGEDYSSVGSLYLFKNSMNLIPKSVGSMKNLKTLKFFRNDLNLFPAEVNELVNLECLQVKAGSGPGLGGLEIAKMESLKDLELSRAPMKLSGLPLLSEIAGLKELKKLSVSHFDIRYIPPEIECLTNLENLNLSFNKIKNLPVEITKLSSLLCLDVSVNKLVELPSGMSCLERLEELDVSGNRLTSLGCLELELETMCNLKKLNLQGNRIRNAGSCKIPSLICCNLEGNFEGNELSCSSSSSGLDVVVPPSPRMEKKSKPKGWKRRLQQKLERSSRKRKVQNNTADFQNSVSSLKNYECESTLKKQKNVDDVDDAETKKTVDGAESMKENVAVIDDGETPKKNVDDDETLKKKENVAVVDDGDVVDSEEENDGDVDDSEEEKERCCVVLQTKRQCDSGPDDNPKKRKSCRRRQLGNQTDISRKYRRISYCCVNDYLPDGFYDAGRNRPFMSLTEYEDRFPYDSGREVILVDRDSDENLDAIVIRAKALMSRFSNASSSVNESDIASFLAFFVSDHFGGSDRSGSILRIRKEVSGSNYDKPFVCTCSTGNAETTIAKEESMDAGIPFMELCERAIEFTKKRCNSIVVPIGSLQFGVCRHRAVLMKYLCDRMDPPMQCELVRGFYDFTPHAWNVIVTKETGIRLIVDACHPQDIRQETDPEYFSRYIPLTRMMMSESNGPVSISEEIIGETASNTVLECNIGSVKAAAKVRILEVSKSTSQDDIRNFELSCLGEARMLSLMRHHPCIVKYYGHQMSSNDGVLQSTLLMEYIQGGSLSSYLKTLEKTGEKRVSVPLAVSIARDVASAMAGLHEKHVIHRDIKSENILLDLNDNVVAAKLADFDRAIPLRASLHSCCIAHTGGHPPNVCIGTPRWMAPEVYRARNERIPYGVEVDVWSFGCLLFELLTLHIPFSGLTEAEIGEYLERGKRPQLTEELQGFADSPLDLNEYEAGSEKLKFLVSIFCWCTESNPRDRPSADKLHKLLASLLV